MSENNGPFTPWLTNTTEVEASFTGQAGKTYAFYSVARDNTGNVENAPSTPDVSTSVIDITANQPPVAIAGSDQTGNAGVKVALDGSGSYDPDQGPSAITYSWSQTGGPSVTLSNPATATPSFTPLTPGIYQFNLVVNDGAASSIADSVTVYVEPQSPLADTECLFNWAEANCPALFAPSGSATAKLGVYSYRYYWATNAYLGVSSADNHVYYLGADGKLLDEGALSDWLPKAGCQQPPPIDCLFN